MKYLKFFVFTSVMGLYSNCQSKGELYYINLYSTTIKSLSCNDLKNASNKRKLALSDSEIKELTKMFSVLKSIDEDSDIDARISGTFYYNSKKIDFCMSTTIININSKTFLVSDELRDYIFKITV